MKTCELPTMCAKTLSDIVIVTVFLSILFHLSHATNISQTTAAKDFKVCKTIYNDVIISSQLVHNSTRYLEGHASELLATECGFVNDSFTVQRRGYPNGVLTLNKQNIESISIEFSNITGFNNDYFCGFIELHRLELRNNLLTDVNAIGLELNNECSRISMCSISTKGFILDLSGNPLRVIKNTSLCSLTTAKFLSLNNCQLKTIEPGAFEYNTNLKILELQGNYLQNIPPIRQLIQLEMLDVSFNLIESVVNADFEKLIDLDDINLSYNSNISIESNAFDNLQQATKINISHCNIEFVDYLLQKVNFHTVDLSYNRLTYIEGQQFSGNIKHLILNHNKIESLAITTFDRKYYLDAAIIDLSFNALTNLEELVLPLSLKQIDFSHNKIKYFYLKSQAVDEIFADKLSFPEINLESNNLQILPQMRFPEKFDLHGNPLACNCLNSWLFRGTTLINSQSKQPCKSIASFNPGNITVLSPNMLCESSHFNDNRCYLNKKVYRQAPFKDIALYEYHVYSCKFECPFPCYCYTTAYFELVHLYCSNNGTSLIPDFSNHNETLKENNSTLILWLDGNDYTKLCADNFTTFIGVTELYLNNSNVISLDNNTFYSMVLLEVLDLSKNWLKELPAGIFDQTTLLRSLLLGDNSLKILPSNIFHQIRHLQLLHLHNNKLSKLPDKLFRADYSYKEIAIYNNFWKCECDFITNVTEYSNYYSKTILNPNQMFCVKDDGKIVRWPFTDLYTYCKTSNLIKMWIGIGLACFILVIAILAFVFRYEIQVILYSKLKFRLFKRSSSENFNGKMFDAFIAYSSEDSNFLIKDILPKLEQIENPYSLCLHERNFMPGEFIQDAILEAVKVSSRTIVLLTENFVRSGWCMYEFKVAHMQMMEDRCPRIILIVKDDIPKDVNPRLKMYIKTNTYLKWGERLFWQKLYYTMPSERIKQLCETEREITDITAF